MTTRHRSFASVPLPDGLTAARAIALWKAAQEARPEAPPEFLFPPGELHGMTPPMPGHVGIPMLRRARRRHQARLESGA